MPLQLRQQFAPLEMACNHCESSGMEATQDTLLLIGKNSYIGQQLSHYCVADKRNFLQVGSRDCDFLNRKQVEAFLSGLPRASYAVIFLAVINKTVDNSRQSYDDNMRIIENFLEHVARIDLHSMVYFSSVDVYGRPSHLPICEATTPAPDSWYGRAKLHAEENLREYFLGRCPVSILRIPGIYGHAANDRSVIGKMVDSIRRTGQVTITGDGSIKRDYVYIGDLCRLVESLSCIGYNGVLNVATGVSHSISEIVGVIESVLQSRADIVHEPADEERNFHLVFDTSKLRTVFPAFQFSSLSSGVASYLANSVDF
jgi:nucleoside-diphosphate-sugar epimerase